MKNILITLALLVSFSSFGQTAEEYLEKGKEISFSKGDPYDALNMYTKAIEINPNIFGAHYYRAHIKMFDFNDFKGGLEDLIKEEKLGNSFADLHYKKGRANFELGNYYDAIYEYTKAIDGYSKFAGAFLDRGNAKKKLGDLNGACADWKKAKDFGAPPANKLIIDNCN